VWVEWHQVKYLYQKQRFEALPYPLNHPLSFYYAFPSRSAEEAKKQELLFGPNRFDVPLPQFWALMGQHAVAPFFVFQLFCVGLWLLDDYWYYSLFTLCMLVVFESTVVHQV
jgi:cation-transporting ATPase 13A1